MLLNHIYSKMPHNHLWNNPQALNAYITNAASLLLAAKQ